MTGEKTIIYRLSFDFRQLEDMQHFFDTCSPVQRQGTVNEIVIVQKDALHDIGKKIHQFLVRNDGKGNGIKSYPSLDIKLPEILEVRRPKDRVEP